MGENFITSSEFISLENLAGNVTVFSLKNYFNLKLKLFDEILKYNLYYFLIFF